MVLQGQCDVLLESHDLKGKNQGDKIPPAEIPANGTVRRMACGEVFGEYSLFSDEVVRPGSVVAICEEPGSGSFETTVLWLSRDGFAKTAPFLERRQMDEKIDRHTIDFLQTVHELRDVKARDLHRFVAHLSHTAVPFGSKLFRAGDAADRVFLVQKGEVDITTKVQEPPEERRGGQHKRGEEGVGGGKEVFRAARKMVEHTIHTVGPGAILGSGPLYGGTGVHTVSAMARTSGCELFYAPVSVFEALVRGGPRQVLARLEKGTRKQEELFEAKKAHIIETIREKLHPDSDDDDVEAGVEEETGAGEVPTGSPGSPRERERVPWSPGGGAVGGTAGASIGGGSERSIERSPGRGGSPGRGERGKSPPKGGKRPRGGSPERMSEAGESAVLVRGSETRVASPPRLMSRMGNVSADKQSMRCVCYPLVPSCCMHPTRIASVLHPSFESYMCVEPSLVASMVGIYCPYMVISN